MPAQFTELVQALTSIRYELVGLKQANESAFRESQSLQFVASGASACF